MSIKFPSLPLSESKPKLLDDYSQPFDPKKLDSWFCSEFQLESGQFARDVNVAYMSFGNLNSSRSNCLLICHALTGNPNVFDWWSGLIGPGKAFDTEKYFIICMNIIGSCYGTTAIHPDIDENSSYPTYSVRDAAAIQLRLLKEKFEISKLFAVVGGSLGGMIAMECLCIDPEFVHCLVLLSCSARQGAWQRALNHIQRQLIDQLKNDSIGLSLARQLAMITYRTCSLYSSKFTGSGEVEKYLNYQGNKFCQRFDSRTYNRLTKMLDSHDIQRGREENYLKTLNQSILIFGISSDLLYPIEEQKSLAKMFPISTFIEIQSEEGHDGFLLEQNFTEPIIREFLDKQYQKMSNNL